MNNISKFKEQRKILRLSQTNFCSLLGISQGYLSDLESNKKVPSKSLMLLLDYISGSKLNDGLPVDKDSSLFKQQYLDLLEKHTKTLEENIHLKEKLYGGNNKINGNAA
jgi:transcriptional regulator with XRE-family HTH domain